MKTPSVPSTTYRHRLSVCKNAPGRPCFSVKRRPRGELEEGGKNKLTYVSTRKMPPPTEKTMLPAGRKDDSEGRSRACYGGAVTSGFTLIPSFMGAFVGRCGHASLNSPRTVRLLRCPRHTYLAWPSSRVLFVILNVCSPKSDDKP